MRHKSFQGKAAVTDAPEGLAELVVSAYGNVDHEGDIVLKGASSKQIKGQYGPANPKGMLDHNDSMLAAVAKTLDWWEEDDGLHIKAQYNLEKQAGREAFSDLLFYGDDMEFSVGYAVKETAPLSKAQQDLGAKRAIKEWMIGEWSHVSLGMNSDTRLISAKSFTDQQVEVLQKIADDALTPTEPVEEPAEEQTPEPPVEEPDVEREPVADAIDPMSVAKFRHLVASTRT